MNKHEAAYKMIQRRDAAGLSQREIALATGISQGQVSAFEREEGSLSPTAMAYLDLITNTPVDQLRDLAREAEEKEKAKKQREEASREAAKVLPVIAREIRAFRTRTRMGLEDVADVIGFSLSHTYRIIRGEVMPDEDKLNEIRTAMAKYEGRPYTPVRPVTDKPGLPPFPKKPQPPAPVAPKPKPKQVEETAAVPALAPKLEAVDTTGVFLANGTNLAPHLTLDGKTMHVFTIVPGGVYLSKLTAKENA